MREAPGGAPGGEKGTRGSLGGTVGAPSRESRPQRLLPPGLDIDGLYRISGNLATIQKLRYKVDHGEARPQPAPARARREGRSPPPPSSSCRR